MGIYRWTLFVFIICILKIGLTDGEIHRTKTTSHKTGGKSSRVWEDVAGKTVADDMFGSETFDTWVFAIFGSCLVGLSGIFPLLIIPIEAGPTLKHGGKFLSTNEDSEVVVQHVYNPFSDRITVYQGPFLETYYVRHLIAGGYLLSN